MTPLERQRRRRAKLAKKAARQKDTALQKQARRADYDARACKGGTVADLKTLAASGQRFAVIYADPPWACCEPFRRLGAFCRRQFLADYTITMFGFDFRQGQPSATRHNAEIGASAPSAGGVPSLSSLPLLRLFDRPHSLKQQCESCLEVLLPVERFERTATASA